MKSKDAARFCCKRKKFDKLRRDTIQTEDENTSSESEDTDTERVVTVKSKVTMKTKEGLKKENSV